MVDGSIGAGGGDGMEILGGRSALLRSTRRFMERRVINGASSDDDDGTDDSEE